MMTEPSGTNGFTQKEMLVRIDAKTDAILARVAVLEVKQAVTNAEIEAHKLLAVHPEGQAVIDNVRDKTESLRGSIRFAAGGVAVLVILMPILYRVIFS